MAIITGFITVADVTDGSTSGFVIIYQRALVEPAVPADTTGFIPASQTFTAPTGWAKTIPAGSNSLYVTTATYNQDTTTLEWSEVILLSGAEGDDGSRGPGRWNHRVGTSLAASYTDAQLDAFLATAVPGTNEDTPVASDQLWLYASSTPSDANPTAQMVYLYNGSSWNEQEEVIDGDLLVAGTVTADNVVANVSLSAPVITGGTLRASVIEGAIIKSLVDVTPVNQDLADSLFASSAEKKRAFTRRIGSDPAELSAVGFSGNTGIDTAISDISIGSSIRLLNVNQDIPASVSDYVTTPTATSRNWHTHAYHEITHSTDTVDITNGNITQYVVLPDNNNSVTLKWPSVTVTIKDGNDAIIATATRAAESKTIDASTLIKGSITDATTTETTFSSGRFEHFTLYPSYSYSLSSYYRSAGDYTWADNFSILERPNYDSRGNSNLVMGAGFIHLQDDEYIEVSIGAIDTTFTGGSPEHSLTFTQYSVATISDAVNHLTSSDTNPSRSDVYFNSTDQISSGDDDPGDILSTEGDDTDNTYVIPKSAFDDSDSVSYDPITNKIIVDDVVGANITGTIDGNVTSLVNVSGGAITGDITEANLIVGEADVNITGSSTTIAGKGAFIINDGSDEPVFGIGDFDNNKYMSYDLNDGLVVRGTLNADDVIAGSLKGGTLVSSAIPTDSTKGSYLDLDNGTFVFGDSAEHLAYDGTNFTFSGIAIDAEDLNNLAALDGKIQGSGLQNYADSTAYDAGTLVISDDRLFEAINAILATNTTNPEDDSTNWKEISASTATDTTYTAGTGLTLTGTEFSVTNPFTDTDETKLDGIETAATADQTDAEIVTAAGSDTNIKSLIDFTGTPVFTDTDTDTTYTASTGITLTGTAFSVTNPFTDADETKLDGIETSATADQTDAEIVNAAGSDTNLKSLIDFTGTPVFTDTDTDTTYTASTGITLTGTAFSVTNPFTDADETKLDGIETSATADQTDAEIVTAAGSDANLKALIDATNPVFTDTDTNTTYTASTGITLTGTAFSVTNPFTDADETKLDGIETAATADQTDAEIITAVNTNTKIKALTDFTGTPVFTDTQRTDENIRDVIGSAMTSGTDITVTVSDSADTITINHSDTSTVNDFNDTDGDGTPDVANLGALVNRMNFDSNGHVTGYGFLSQDVDTGKVTLSVSGTDYSLDINANSITADEVNATSLFADSAVIGSISSNVVNTTNLNAQFANLGTLAADVATIGTLETGFLEANHIDTLSLNAATITAYDATPMDVSIGITDSAAGPRTTTGVVTTFDYRDGPLSSSTSLTAAETATWADLVGQHFHFVTEHPEDIDSYVGAAGFDTNFTLRFQSVSPSAGAEFNLTSATKVSDAVVSFELGSISTNSNVIGVPTPGTGDFPANTIFIFYGTTLGEVSVLSSPPTIEGTTTSGVGTVINSDGDLFAGDSDGNHIFWDTSAGVLNLRGSLNASDLSEGSIDASSITITNLNASNITTGSIDADNVNVTNISADNINAGTLSVDRINGLEIAITEEIGNTGVGTNTFDSISGGSANTAFGFKALENVSSGTSNVGVGFVSLRNVTSGSHNVALGRDTGGNITTGEFNTLLGANSGNRMTTGSHNVGVGRFTFGNKLLGSEDITGVHNVAIGAATSTDHTLGDVTTGNGNVAVGSGALADLTTGSNNIAIGANDETSFTISSAAGNLTTGNHNIVIGQSALADSVASSDVVAIGKNAGANDNTANSSQAAVSDVSFTSRDTSSFLSSGRWDVRDGNDYLDDSVDYSAWSGWGSQFLATDFSTGNTTLQASLREYISGLSVIVTIGTASATFTVASVTEDLFGAFFLELGTPSSIIGVPATTGSISVDFSSFTISPDNHRECVFLGGQSSKEQPTAGLSNSSSLGFDAAVQLSGDDEVAIGNTSITSIKGQVAFGTYSDERDKTDFEDLDLGLDFINSLNAKKFSRNSRERYYEEQPKLVDGEVVLESVFNEEAYTAGLKKDKTDTIGFIAQDLQEQLDLLDKSNYDFCDNSNPEKLNVKYGDMTAILWKAVQELSTSNDELKARIEALEG